MGSEMCIRDSYKGPLVNEDWRDSNSELLRPLFEARIDYINAAFNEIFNKYDKIEDFVISELEVDIKTIDIMKRRILE